MDYELILKYMFFCMSGCRECLRVSGDIHLTIIENEKIGFFQLVLKLMQGKLFIAYSKVTFYSKRTVWLLEVL